MSYRDDDRRSRRDDDDSNGRRRVRDEDNRDDRGRDRDRGSRSRDDDREERGRRDDRDEGRSSRSRDRDDDRGGRGSSRGRFEYQKRSDESTKRRQSMGANDYDKFLKDHIKMWKPNDGDNRIRILPPTWDNADHYGLDIYMHYGVGPDRQSYLCLDKMLGKADPIAEEYARVRDEGDDKYAKELSAKRRVLVYLIDRDHPKEGVQAWAMPWTLDRDITKVSEDRSTGEVLTIDHPYDGYDVEFTKKGAKDRTEYMGVAISRRSTELGNDDWLDFARDNPLPDQLVYHDYETIAKAFGGQGQQRRGRDDDRDREEGRSSRSRDDRDDDRGGRSRDRDDDRNSRDDDRGQRGRSADPEKPTWSSIHAMTKTELLDLIDDERLDINPGEAKDTEDLADWICEEMKLKKEEPADGGRRRSRDDDAEDRLADMRNRRRD